MFFRKDLRTPQGLQGLVQYGYGYLQGWRYHNLSGQPVPALVIFFYYFFFSFYGYFVGIPLLQLVSVASCPFPVPIWEEPGSIPFISSLNYWKTAVKSLLLFLAPSKQVHLASACMSSAVAPTCFGGQSLDLLQYVSVSYVLDTVVLSHQC